MKPRHAAALTLVGWYLIAPPLDGGGNVLMKTSLPQWQIIASYDSAYACQESKSNEMQTSRADVDRLLKNAPANVTDSDLQKFLHADSTSNRAAAAICISTDDPRLKP
jgi:hypothetical protein